MSTTSAAVESSQSAADLGILDRIIAETKLTPDDEAYDIAKRGVSAFIEELLKPQNENEPVKKAMVDRMIAEIDAKLSRQMDEILHHQQFQSLESSWRGLKLLVDRTNFRENIKLEILNASKQAPRTSRPCSTSPRWPACPTRRSSLLPARNSSAWKPSPACRT
jgi:type VI secretion system protein ImpC